LRNCFLTRNNPAYPPEIDPENQGFAANSLQIHRDLQSLPGRLWGLLVGVVWND
jgi:hypothetical protein